MMLEITFKEKYPYSKKATIYGIRGCCFDSDKLFPLANTFNEYNDTIIVEKGNRLTLFTGTVDPGDYYTINPMFYRGCAHLKNGTYLYKKGYHFGHPALVQAGPVSVYCDTNRNGKIELVEKEISGWFGINIHAGSGLKFIGMWSAGCINISKDWNHIEWKKFISLFDDVEEPIAVNVLDYDGSKSRKVMEFLDDFKKEVLQIKSNRSEIFYTIRPGDMLSGIAKKFNTTVQRIAELNDLVNANKIQAGKQIWV